MFHKNNENIFSAAFYILILLRVHQIIRKTVNLTFIHPAITNTLHNWGKSQRVITKETGCSQSAVSRHNNGRKSVHCCWDQYSTQMYLAHVTLSHSWTGEFRCILSELECPNVSYQMEINGPFHLKSQFGGGKSQIIHAANPMGNYATRNVFPCWKP